MSLKKVPPSQCFMDATLAQTFPTRNCVKYFGLLFPHGCLLLFISHWMDHVALFAVFPELDYCSLDRSSFLLMIVWNILALFYFSELSYYLFPHWLDHVALFVVFPGQRHRSLGRIPFQFGGELDIFLLDGILRSFLFALLSCVRFYWY